MITKFVVAGGNMLQLHVNQYEVKDPFVLLETHQ